MNSKTYLVTLLLISQSFCDKTIEVELKQGNVIGKVENTLYNKQQYNSFKGIPFAEAPVNELRFQPPQRHQGWDGSLEAFENKPTCMQFSSRLRMKELFGVSGSEDCLYISIFTPDTKGSAPVIVFDYNDSFRTWFNGTDTYSPDFLLEEGVVVVTISHRLGMLGYLTTEDEVILGNNGLRDFILGLEWVKQNIDKFGGDASKVTLMGSQGGAALAEILLYSEKASGLFSAAILQSGTALESFYFYDKPKQKAFELGEHWNLTTTNSQELLEGLQKIDATELVHSEKHVLNYDNVDKFQIHTIPFAPTIEYNNKDGVITELPENSKIVNDVPIIIGFNSREGLELISHLLFSPKLLRNDHDKKLFQFPVRSNYRFDPASSKYEDVNKEIVDFYLEDKSLHYGNLEEYAVYEADVNKIYALNVAATKLSEELSSPVFYYMFDFRGLWNENSEYLISRINFHIENGGATIVDELCYLLVCSRIKKTYEELFKLPSEQREVKVMKKMVRLWSNFAKTRNPTPAKDDDVLKGLVWEPLKRDANNYLHITKVLKMKTNPLEDRNKFWDELLEKYSKIAIDGVVTDDTRRDEL